jgi:L-asparaginase
MKKNLFIFTGGTISMRIDPVLGAAVPVLSGEEILSFVPNLDQLAHFEVLDFARLPGPHMTPEKMFELSELLNQQLERPDLCGAVITHGTDTLEETAYMLDLRLTSAKPVAVAGAMRNSSELGWDGPNNLRAAVRVVLDEPALEKGVFVVLNNVIHAASEVTKTHTEALDTFQSPDFGPLGIVDKDRVLWSRNLVARQVMKTNQIELKVDLFKMVAGANGRCLEYAVACGSRG